MVRLPVRMMSYRRNSAENEKWCCGVVVITTAQLHSTKLEFKFCASSNPARGVWEIRDAEDLWEWSHLEISLNVFRWSTIPKTIHHRRHHHHHHGAARGHTLKVKVKLKMTWTTQAMSLKISTSVGPKNDKST